MPTLTLKNIPDSLHERLKASGERNGRSLNSDVLVRLGRDIGRPVLDQVVHAEKLRAFAARLLRVVHQHVTRYRRQGRA